MKKIVLLIVCGILIISFNFEFEITTEASSLESAVKQHEGLPDKLNNKYWMAKKMVIMSSTMESDKGCMESIQILEAFTQSGYRI